MSFKSFNKKAVELIKNHLVVAITLFIAIVGGIPGILSIYDYFFENPQVTMFISRVDYGTLKWPEREQEYSYVLLELEVTNEENHPIQIPPIPFNISVKFDYKWKYFEGMAIPWSGTVLFKSEQDKSGANIDHLDLQKFRELNVSMLYGHHSQAGLQLKDKYTNTKYFLLALNAAVTMEELQNVFKDRIDNDNLPIKVFWKDMRGETHKPYLVVCRPLNVTSGCYKVMSNNIKYF